MVSGGGGGNHEHWPALAIQTGTRYGLDGLPKTLNLPSGGSELR